MKVFILVKLKFKLVAEEDQSNLLKNIVKFNNKSRARTKEGKNKNRDIYESIYGLYEGRELTLNFFIGIFPIKATQGEGVKIFTPKLILWRLTVAFVQVQAGNASENLPN